MGRWGQPLASRQTDAPDPGINKYLNDRQADLLADRQTDRQRSRQAPDPGLDEYLDDRQTDPTTDHTFR